MNSMMPISHRLFAAAATDGAAIRKPKPVPGRPVIIEVGRGGVSPAWVDGQPAPSHPMISPAAWLEGGRGGA